jgi:hypothetical protein
MPQFDVTASLLRSGNPLLKFLLAYDPSYAPGQRLSVFGIAAQALSGLVFGIRIATTLDG